MPKWWPFNREPKVDPEALFREAEASLRQELQQKESNGVARQALINDLETEGAALEKQESTPEINARLRAIDLIYSELRPQVMDNLSTGKAHEMAGRIDEAVACYETAVVDQVATRFPYEHLRIIYNRQSQYEDALRICDAALENPFISDKDHAHFKKWGDRFRSHLESLQA